MAIELICLRRFSDRNFAIVKHFGNALSERSALFLLIFGNDFQWCDQKYHLLQRFRALPSVSLPCDYLFKFHLMLPLNKDDPHYMFGVLGADWVRSGNRCGGF